jgi:radical SAM protein with 4Fe4S-binding SPASM domain
MHRHGEARPASAADRRPVVVWNCTKACNLACSHCYASAKANPAAGELTGGEARSFLDDLARFGVPAVLLSGGEPLVRPDLVDLLEYGRARGLRFTLSTNGTLIDDAEARRLAAAGLVYAGVSIDGDRLNHDRQRRELGAYDAAIAGLRRLGQHGVRRGVRFTITPDTIDSIDAVFGLVLQENVERLCVYHLVPQGRGARLVDVSPDERRAVVERVFEFAVAHPEVEVLTVDNPSDGALLYHWLRARDEERATWARDAMEWNTGAKAGSGVAIACVTECGDVHPDQFSRARVLGNLRERPFSSIWTEPDDEFVLMARCGDRPVPSTCQGCADYAVCGGGFRARAEGVTGDPWGADPSCQLAGASV